MYSKEELEKFLTLAEKKLSHDWFVFFRLLAYTGMRRGEALALTWDDINEEDSTVYIHRTATRGSSGLYISDTPKTNKSNRTIYIDKTTLELVLSLRREEDTGKSFIFQNSNGSFFTPSLLVKKIHTVVSGTDLKYITPHGFRHTHCSLLFSAGVSIPEVQDRLGHSDVKTTIDIYNHVYKKDRKTALDKLMKYMA
ncbi:MAG: site-specific integrase [Anaerovoracaceae bacterium]